MKKHTIRYRGAAIAAALAATAFAGISLAGAQTTTASSTMTTEPVISSINAMNTGTGATITWNTDQPADAQVVYGTSTPYTASSTLTSGQLTSQSVTLYGLAPNTTYHYAVISANGSGSMNSSTDQTFTTGPAASGTLSVNASTGQPGSSFAVTGNGFQAYEPVTLNFNGATSTVTADANGHFVSTINIPSASVSVNTPVTISGSGVWSNVMASAPFTIVPSSTNTSTSTSTTSTSTSSGSSTSTLNFAAIENELAQLRSLIALIRNEMKQFFANGGTLSINSSGVTASGGGTNVTGTMPGATWPATNLSATIDNPGSVRTGTSVDFTGRNWGEGEQVQVMNGGAVVATVQADDGGNFSTGSLPVTSAPGMQTYTFKGLATGLTRTATVTVTQ